MLDVISCILSISTFFTALILNLLSNPQFVRLSDQTEMRLVLDLLTKYWKLSKPQLVISLTGGGRSFKLNEKNMETFSRGLIKVRPDMPSQCSLLVRRMLRTLSLVVQNK